MAARRAARRARRVHASRAPQRTIGPGAGRGRRGSRGRRHAAAGARGHGSARGHADDRDSRTSTRGCSISRRGSKRRSTFPTKAFTSSRASRPPASCASVQASLETLIRDGRAGRVVRDGSLVVIAGRPNAGKSSLFNALVGAARAIVTDVPGTTRDLLTERVDIGGLPVTLVDTAGLREAADAIEVEGVRRARAGAGDRGVDDRGHRRIRAAVCRRSLRPRPPPAHELSWSARSICRARGPSPSLASSQDRVVDVSALSGDGNGCTSASPCLRADLARGVARSTRGLERASPRPPDGCADVVERTQTAPSERRDRGAAARGARRCAAIARGDHRTPRSGGSAAAIFGGSASASSRDVCDFDVIVIGAGHAGMRGRVGGGAPRLPRRPVHAVGGNRRAHAVQSRDRRDREGPPGSRDRCARRPDGARDRRHRHPVQAPQSQPRAGGVVAARAGRQAPLRRVDARGARTRTEHHLAVPARRPDSFVGRSRHGPRVRGRRLGGVLARSSSRPARFSTASCTSATSSVPPAARANRRRASWPNRSARPASKWGA